ncbi:MAG TPA: hypothetical protein VI298_09245 [Geobacteraceae bacterium]
MSRLMRMAYGHGGTTSRRVLVAAPRPETAAGPRWPKLLFLAVWIAVPLLVCRFSLPTPTPSTTVIDMSRLETPPPPELESPVIPEPPPPPPAQPAQKPLAQPPPEEAQRPAITRPTAAGVAEAPAYRPRIARERVRAVTESDTPAAMRIRRETAAPDPSAERTAITRTRHTDAADLPTPGVRVANLRRAPAREGETGGTETVRPFTRGKRSADLSVPAEGGVPRIASSRERRGAAGEENGGAAGGVGFVRGVSLASLEICATPQAEEDAVKAVLARVGARQSCRDETGEYQFTGTRRISSFNLIIRPAKGRRPTNRCEELENAYSCLKAH